jgi:hypothetical protein
MLDRKREQLRREIARRERELEKLESLPDLSAMADGSIVALFVRHAGSKPYTYVAYLTRGRFYLTGKTSPDGVTAEELADWLTTSGRSLVGTMPVAILETGVVPAFDLGEALVNSLTETPVRRGGFKWRDFNEYGS